ncbi:hypothetical protein [Brevibacterium gallinarum]|uniref:Uncharacterized protein n=1 Tax=Brevibacterium gallinarum TaxID=2762220 RepID=A0ABR8WQJ2_9MICO|nr:hypothetical protein [Brevibacterium gallinarum]MBD8019218.1 hypothetical protein [Brevibacterium gallinarum]
MKNLSSPTAVTQPSLLFWLAVMLTSCADSYAFGSPVFAGHFLATVALSFGVPAAALWVRARQGFRPVGFSTQSPDSLSRAVTIGRVGPAIAAAYFAYLTVTATVVDAAFVYGLSTAAVLVSQQWLLLRLRQIQRDDAPQPGVEVPA